ncbi:SHOCT domain-containing protein [Aureimonas glaciei]|uniref:SHOCT domain-containing protein n=1 Tax=Aureimonas glaciei TaxID=1776957 RepID=A0A916Y1L7_9HYPH|nr:SHOCT domain-containing protein [Aureimonas glaciei]GGD27181.1 hypothetical protein GCM10011335_32800 [Aureimonas glaciei]
MTEKWSAEAQRRIAEIAAKNGFSAEAGLAMAEAITRGVGSMAQFNHRDLGGQGQWVKGGMLMVADMFNDGLKARVRSLAEALAEAAQRGAIQPTSPGESGSAGAAGADPGAAVPRDSGGETGGSVSRDGKNGAWWPSGLGQPQSSGAQNGLRYAIFPAARRVAIERGGKVSVHDSGEHRIGGISQQQGAHSSLRFTSQHGEVGLDALPEVDGGASAGSAAPGDSGDPDRQRPSDPKTPRGAGGKIEAGASERPSVSPEHPPSPVQAAPDARSTARDPLELIRQLADLRDAGILTEAEFAAKKTELLARL